jgi:hypothetical protein
VIFNTKTKTFKNVIDEDCSHILSNFIQNTHLSTTLFKKNETDEFFVKDENFCFYYYRLGYLVFLMLYDKEITIDDMNSVKLNLKTYLDHFEEKETIPGGGSSKRK